MNKITLVKICNFWQNFYKEIFINKNSYWWLEDLWFVDVFSRWKIIKAIQKDCVSENA